MILERGHCPRARDDAGYVGASSPVVRVHLGGPTRTAFRPVQAARASLIHPLPSCRIDAPKRQARPAVALRVGAVRDAMIAVLAEDCGPLPVKVIHERVARRLEGRVTYGHVKDFLTDHADLMHRGSLQRPATGHTPSPRTSIPTICGRGWARRGTSLTPTVSPDCEAGQRTSGRCAPPGYAR